MKKKTPHFDSKERLSVYIGAAFISATIIFFLGEVERTVIVQAARALISMVAFLAAASVALISFYLGQILKSVVK